jgi:uncharacterized protein YoxC
MTFEEMQQAIEGMLNVQRNLQETQSTHTAEIDDLRQSVRGLTEAVDRLVTLGTETFAVVREMQAEVRGLQTENRRILDRVFGEQSN